jgi:hypothetical protein
VLQRQRYFGPQHMGQRKIENRVTHAPELHSRRPVWSTIQTAERQLLRRPRLIGRSIPTCRRSKEGLPNPTALLARLTALTAAKTRLSSPESKSMNLLRSSNSHTGARIPGRFLTPIAPAHNFAMQGRLTRPGFVA